MYYFATPHVKVNIKNNELDFDKLGRNEKITRQLEEAGFQIFLPYRDTDQSLCGKKLLDRELNVIKNCEGVIVALSNTRGVYMEAGYAKALGKKLIGLKIEETREFSEWGYAFFDFVASNNEELIKYLKNSPK